MPYIPSNLHSFVNHWTTTEVLTSGREAYCFHGDLYYDRSEYLCENCKCSLEIHNRYHVQLRHICSDKIIQ